MGDRYWLWVGARLLVAVAIVGWAASYIGTGSGEKEFQRTLDAMKQIHSFRAATVASPLTQHNEFLWEVDCGRNIAHYQEHITNQCGDDNTHCSNIDMSREELDWAVYEYDRQSDGSWQASRHPAGNRTRYLCGHLSDGTDSNLLPPIATMIRRGIIQKGDKKTVNGVRCREYLVTMKGAPGGLEHDTVCLGLEDRLPYEWTVDWEKARTSFSDYNTAIQFDLPAEVVKETSASTSN